MNKMLLRVNEAAEALNVSRWRIFELIRTGELDSIKLGASRRIPVEAIHSYIKDRLEEAS